MLIILILLGGFINYGKLITSNGKIIKYGPASKHTNKTIDEKLKNGEVIKTISSDIVDMLYQLLLDSKDYMLIDKGHVACDAGSTSHTGYLFNQNTREKIELSTNGNYLKYNGNPSAIELVNKINELIGNLHQ